MNATLTRRTAATETANSTANSTAQTRAQTGRSSGSSIADCRTEPTWFDRLQRGSLVLSTVLVGLAAGFFFTYQISVTRGLALVDDASYVASFQAINETIRNAYFGIVFFGALPVLVATLALHWRGNALRRGLVALSLAFYGATFAITAAGSVPLNNQLATVTDRSGVALAAARADFESTWNTLNLIRTLTCLLALLAIALVGRIGRGTAASAEPVRD